MEAAEASQGQEPDQLGETERLAAYAATLRYEDIPQPVLDRARKTICDTVGAMIFGYDLPWSRMVVDYAATYGHDGPCRILGPDGPSVEAPMAALANGALAHAFELDGGTIPFSGAHPCATIFPAALAVAQERNLSGRELLTAFVAATEVMVRIARATKRTNEERGFHAPGTTGPFGAAVAVGRLLGFDGATMTNALGIAGSLSSGLVQFARAGTGGMVKRLHFGRAAEGGILAANLADSGFTGPHNIIEGEFGFLRVFCNSWDVSQLTRELGEDYLTLSIFFKPFACHGQALVPLQALADLRAEHDFSSADVDSIVVRGNDSMLKRNNIRRPADAMVAQYSVPFCVALSFFRDPRDPRSFDAAAVKDPQILALMDKVELVAEDLAAHGPGASSVMLKLKDGRVLECRLTAFKGTPASPPTWDEVREKFMLLTRHCPEKRMNEVFDRLRNIEGEENFEWLRV